jgi:hypothetical protein
MKRKDEEQERARQLRAEGWTLRRIANELDVALSSVSVWVRDVVAEEPEPVDPVAVLAAANHAAEPLRALPIVASAAQLRLCSKCRRRLSEQHFGRHPDNGRQWWCKSCFKGYFAKRGQLHRDQVAEARRLRRAESRRIVAAVFVDGCRDCGERDRTVLEFDHVGAKLGNVSDMVRGGVAPRRVQAEISRCEVVCVNCHRLRTLERLDRSWRLDEDLIACNPSLSTGQRRNMLYVQAYLQASNCTDCGLGDIRLLEFDHVFGKTANVTVLAREGCSLHRLQAEVSRCEVRCPNCHRRRTIQEIQRNRSLKL